MKNRYLGTAVICLVLAAVLVCLFGCDAEDFIAKSRQTLWANRAAWQDVQDLAAGMRANGELDDTQWAQIESLDAKFRSVHNSAVLALDEYSRLKDDSGKELVLKLLAESGAVVRQAGELIEAWKKK